MADISKETEKIMNFAKKAEAGEVTLKDFTEMVNATLDTLNKIGEQVASFATVIESGTQVLENLANTQREAVDAFNGIAKANSQILSNFIPGMKELMDTMEAVKK